MVKKYWDLVLESKINLLLEGKFIVSPRFIKTIEKMYEYGDDDVACLLKDIILDLCDEDCEDVHSQNFLDVVDGKDDMISFISDKSFDRINNNSKVRKSEYFTLKGRSEIKIGRFVRQILKQFNIKFSDNQIESFVNMWKSLRSGSGERFEIVSGHDIKKYYDSSSYAEGFGNLNSSCMGFSHCQSYFDIYVKNPNQCKMLILINPYGKLLGRSLIWKVNKVKSIDKSFDPEWVMDRIYTTKDSDMNKFKSYAMESKWAYRYYLSNLGPKSVFTFRFGGKISTAKIDIKLDVGGKFGEYPFLDTFFFYDMVNNLSNSGYRIGKKQLILQCTEGAYFLCDECGDSRLFDVRVQSDGDCPHCLGSYDDI